MRELEAQHPLVSGCKPNFPVLFAPVQVLTNAKAEVDIHSSKINSFVHIKKSVQEYPGAQD